MRTLIVYPLTSILLNQELVIRTSLFRFLDNSPQTRLNHLFSPSKQQSHPKNLVHPLSAKKPLSKRLSRKKSNFKCMGDTWEKKFAEEPSSSAQEFSPKRRLVWKQKGGEHREGGGLASTRLGSLDFRSLPLGAEGWRDR